MLPSGGGIRVATQFAEGLSSAFSVKVYRPEGGVSFRSSHPVSEQTFLFPMWKRPSGLLKPVSPLFLILRLYSFRRLCKTIAESMNTQADIALVHNSLPIASPPVLNYLNIPSLYYCYEYPRHIYESDIIRRSGNRFTEFLLKPLAIAEKEMDRSSVAEADSIATFSTYMKNRIQSIYSRNASIIRPGVDTSFFFPVPSTNRENYILSVGALWPFKGHEKTLRILAAIKNKPKLVITADRAYPGYKKHLEAISSDAGIQLAIEEGVTDSRLRDLYRQAKLVICCQKREPYGLVPLEAMACGTPVLAVAEGGFPDNIEHNKTGFLFDGTVSHGAHILKMILNNRELAEAAGSAGREFVMKERCLSSGINQLAREIDRL